MEEQKIRTKETKSREEGIARMSSEKKNITENTVQQQSQSQPQTSVTLVAKWGKERITMENLSPSTTLGQVKEIITEKTKILPKRQKLMGLTLDTSKKSGTTSAGKGLKLTDETVLMDLKVKKKSNNLKTNPSFNEEDMINVIRHDFILMGTPEEQIFVDPSDVDDLPEVIDDFDLDFSAGSNEVRYNIILSSYCERISTVSLHRSVGTSMLYLYHVLICVGRHQYLCRFILIDDRKKSRRLNFLNDGARMN